MVLTDDHHRVQLWDTGVNRVRPQQFITQTFRNQSCPHEIHDLLNSQIGLVNVQAGNPLSWLIAWTSDLHCSMQPQTSFFKAKASFMYPILECVFIYITDIWISFVFHSCIRDIRDHSLLISWEGGQQIGSDNTLKNNDPPTARP